MPADGLRICFRFDVDTCRCARQGLPALLDLAARLELPLTLFFNMGRAVSRRHALAALAGRRPAAPPAAKLSNLAKLGTAGYLRTLVANPWVGRGAPGVVRRAAAEGHEVGLHGGRNHGEWMRCALGWGGERLRAEVRWGLAELARAGAGAVRSFASPGWVSPPGLPEVLAEEGFALLADRHGLELEGPLALAGGRLRDWPTNVLGEPGGVGFIEHQLALGRDPAAAVTAFRAALAGKRRAMLYDHPHLAGGRGLGLLERLVEAARGLGYRPVTLAGLEEAER